MIVYELTLYRDLGRTRRYLFASLPAALHIQRIALSFAPNELTNLRKMKVR